MGSGVTGYRYPASPGLEAVTGRGNGPCCLLLPLAVGPAGLSGGRVSALGGVFDAALADDFLESVRPC